jgi:transposase
MYEYDHPNRQQVHELNKALPNATDKNRVPIQALLLYYFGTPLERLIAQLRISVPDFQRWLQAYENGGLAAVTAEANVVSEFYKDAIKVLLSKPPRDVDSEFSFWTVERLKTRLTLRTGITLTVAELKQLLKAMGYRTKRFYRIEV